MDFDVKTLIEHVKLRPALWDHKHDDYHNRRAIEKLWIEISQQIKVPAEFLKKKWKYLRDQFRIECRKIPKEMYEDSLLTIADFEPHVSWTFFKSLFFLKSQIKNIKPKRRQSNDENEELADDSKDMTTDIGAEEQHDFGKMFVLENISSIAHDDYNDQIIQVQKEPQIKVLTETYNATNDDERFKRLEKKLDTAIAQQSKRRHFDDEIEEDRAFFASILPHIRKLTPAEKMLCRIDIQNTVYKHVYKADKV